MGRGLGYSLHERRALAIAYINASNDSVDGADQNVPEFGAKIITNLLTLQPTGAEPGHYVDRDETGVTQWQYLRDSVFGDIQKFNHSFLLVEQAEISGITDQEMINIAVALHLGRIDHPDRDARDTNPTDWTNYLAWLELRVLPKFDPHSSSHGSSAS